MNPCALQHQKRRLESILGILLVRQHPTANAKHHRAMPAHKGLERKLIAACRKTVRAVRTAVRQIAASAPARRLEQMLNDPIHTIVGHRYPFRNRCLLRLPKSSRLRKSATLYLLFPVCGQIPTLFLFF